MLNNSFEEIVRPSKVPNIKELHSNMIDKMSLPEWTKLTCPYCKESMPTSAVRSVTIKLNPRNIGDLCVEFLCPKCEVGNTLYFTKASKDLWEFINLLNGSKSPSVEPITEEEMYKQKYHNVLDASVSKKET